MKASQIEAKRWFRQACADIEVVKVLKEAGHYAASCFYSQQAAEKALKSVLYSQGNRIVLGHSVFELLKNCAVYDPIFDEKMSESAFLDQFYIPTRYPNGLPSPTIPSEIYDLSQANDALNASESIIQLVKVFLESHSGSND